MRVQPIEIPLVCILTFIIIANVSRKYFLCNLDGVRPYSSSLITNENTASSPLSTSPAQHTMAANAAAASPRTPSIDLNDEHNFPRLGGAGPPPQG